MSTTGKYLSLRTGAGVGTVFAPKLTEWTAEETGEELDATSAASDGYEDTDDGVTGVRISCRCLHDPADGAVPNIGKGQIITDVKAYGNVAQTTAVDYELPVAIVVRPGRAVRVRGQIEITFEVRNKGLFYRDGVAARSDDDV